MFAPWKFEPVPPQGGSTGSGQRRALSGSSLTLAQQMGRELTQNSGDAEKNSIDPVVMNFRITHLEGAARQKLLETIRIGETTSRKIPAPPNGKLPLFYIEDHQTLGLGGYERADRAVDNRRDHRYAGLCLNFGDAELDASGGGTYGFGKSIAWAISNSYIVFFYSRITADKLTDGVHSRLIGLALGNKHPHENRNYTGRAYLGRTEKDGFTGPLTNEEADATAAILGFTPRTASDTGTSILILNSRFSKVEELEEVRAALEKYYWPRIIDGRLKATFTCDGKSLTPPEPERQENLKPFIDSYKRALSLKAGQTLPTVVGQWQGMIDGGDRPLGVMALEAVPEDAPDAEGETDASRDAVALIRTPRMVVKYHKPRQSTDYPYAGVFIADDGINPILAKSEPPNHNEWSDTVEQTEHHVVTVVLKQIRKRTSDFINQMAASEIEPTEGCETLDNELSDLVRMMRSGAGSGGAGKRRKKRKIKPQPPSGPKAYTFVFLSGPELKTNGAERYVAARLQLNVVSAADRSMMGKSVAKAKYFQVVAHPKIVIDDGSFEENPLSVTKIHSKAGGDAKAGLRRIIFPLPAEAFSAEIDVQTAPLEHDDQVIDLTFSGHFQIKPGTEEKQ